MKKSMFGLGIAAALIASVACLAQPASKPASDANAGGSSSAQLAFDVSRAKSTYTNVFRFTGSPEELIIDCGLNPQPVGVPKDPILVEHRIIMNYYTAKRFAAALQMSIERHEQAFGPIETDVNKRLKVIR